MNYKVTVDGKEIEYGALTKRSRFSDEEWYAIYDEMFRRNNPELYEEKKNDEDYVRLAGYAIDLEERYEALLERLPQSAYSKAGTHPEWVADAVEEHTLQRGITQDDVAMFIDEAETLSELIADLAVYFELDDQYYKDRETLGGGETR